MDKKIDKKDLAFDFDGVVADTMALFVALIRNDYGRDDITINKITDYDLRKCIDISDKELMDIGFRIMSEECTTRLRPMEGAVEFLKDYAKKTGSLLIITARPEQKPVELWVKKYLDLDEKDFTVVATGDFDSKAEVLKEHNKRYLVEDRIETCFYLKEKGFEPIVFVQPWNRKPNDFLEVSSWLELSSFLNEC